MQLVQWSLIESETPQLQTTDSVRPTVPMVGNQASGAKEQTDRQATEARYAAFVWLFGSGCY